MTQEQIAEARRCIEDVRRINRMTSRDRVHQHTLECLTWQCAVTDLPIALDALEQAQKRVAELEAWIARGGGKAVLPFVEHGADEREGGKSPSEVLVDREVRIAELIDSLKDEREEKFEVMSQLDDAKTNCHDRQTRIDELTAKVEELKLALLKYTPKPHWSEATRSLLNRLRGIYAVGPNAGQMGPNDKPEFGFRVFSDMPAIQFEAAARIEELEAENARLRAALEQSPCMCVLPYTPGAKRMMCARCTALEGK